MSIAAPLALLEEDLPPNPLTLFTHWYLAAEAAELLEPAAMTLATASADGIPDARMVLLRGFDERGFVFYTNYVSNKAQQLAQNPQAALVFHWAPLLRQIRIGGRVEKVSAAESDAYFHSRPFGHQLGALTSPQSQLIPNRDFLEERLHALEQQYPPGSAIPRPENWGGYRVLPHTIEFWQGRDNRLHDRLRYRLESDRWIVERLAP